VSYQPHKVEGLRVPLFDRLVDSAPEQAKEIAPLRIYERSALEASLARDLGRLLNTRRATAGPLDPARATVLDYGIPDFSHLSAASVTDRRTFAETIRAAITFFEPRVHEVVVQIEPDPRGPARLLALVHCTMKLGRYMEPVTFPLLIHGKEGTVEVLLPESNTGAGSRLTALEPARHG
jgi:type VI secretion system lysozyme-like protein